MSETGEAEKSLSASPSKKQKEFLQHLGLFLISEDKKKDRIVLVTGASGYVCGRLINFLRSLLSRRFELIVL